MILIVLALFLAFSDSTKDMLIMNNLGYEVQEIKKLLISAFFPILTAGLLITAYPSVLIAKAVQTSLAVQMGDYMPFSTNVTVLLIGLLIVAAIYLLAELAFFIGMKRLIRKKSITKYLNSL